MRGIMTCLSFLRACPLQKGNAVPAYGYIGSMRTREGHRDEVIGILLAGADGLRAAGCQLYAVCTDPADADVIWVSQSYLFASTLGLLLIG